MSNKMMTLKDLHAKHLKLGAGEVILDVRKAEEFASGHIENAINIPHENVAQHADDLKKYNTIYLHCKKGGRAKTAFESLSSAGLNNLVCIHDAGMDAWMEAGYPVVK